MLKAGLEQINANPIIQSESCGLSGKNLPPDRILACTIQRKYA